MAENISISCLMTNAGKELQAKAHKLGAQVVFDKISVGDGGGDTAPVPTPYGYETALVNEVWRGDITMKEIDENNAYKLLLHTVIPANDGDFWVRELGVWVQAVNDDGTLDPDTHVLFAYGNHAEYYKTKPVSGQTVTHEIIIPVVISETADVKVIVPDSGYATTSDLTKTKTELTETKTELTETKTVVSGHTESIEELNTVVANILPSTWFHRDELPVATDMGLGIQIYPTSVKIGGSLYKNTTETILPLDDANSWDDPDYTTADNRAGLDVYMYACSPASGTEPVYKLSVSSTCPDGYSEETSRKIGGFHCLCLAVGTIAGHTLNNWATGSILPATVWDLRHYSAATIGNEGQFFFNGRWCGIYLAGWDGERLVNQFGAQIADGSCGTNPADGNGFSGESFAEYAGYIGMQLIPRDMFMQIAEGSNQRTNIKGSADPGTTGGHYDTAGRRMISNYGAEDCCGALWQWTSNLLEDYHLIKDSLNSNKNMYGDNLTDYVYYTGNTWLTQGNGYGANEFAVWEARRTTSGQLPASYNTSGRGQAYRALLRRLLCGGAWSDGAVCGSRSVQCHDLSARRDGYCGGRLVSESMGY